MNEDDDRPEIDLSQVRKNRLGDFRAPVPNPQLSQEVLRLINEAFKHADESGTKKRRVITTKGSVKAGDDETEYMLLRMSQIPNTVYVVEKDDPDISACAFHIDLTTGEAFGAESAAPYNQKSVIEFLTRLRDAGRAPKLYARARRRRKTKRMAIITVSVVGAVSVVVGGYFGFGWLFSATTEPIRSERVYDTGPNSQPIDWSDQYQDQRVSSLGVDEWHEDEEIPTDRPQEVTAPFGGEFDRCDTHTREIREGQRFRVVFYGERGDGFTIRFNHQSSEIEICRTGSEGADEEWGLDPDVEEKKDKIYIQRIEGP